MVSRSAFSLIEILMVIAIIAVLSAMMVASTSAFSGGSKMARTDAILGAVRSALELTLADDGMAATPAEHPLAASRAPRAPFMRADGSAVATAGMALAGVSLDLVAPAAHARVLLADDRFADPAAPHLYGVERAHLGILGVPQAAVTLFRRLPTTITVAIDPDNPTVLPDHEHLVAPTGTPDQHAAHIGRLLGVSGSSELAALGALRTPPEDFTLPLAHGRLLGRAGGRETWEGGHIQDGADPTWKPYCLPGLTIVDGWGTEVLYRNERGAITVQSAGKDRVFRWHPGHDGDLATAADAESPTGDDHDGQRDNRTQGLE